MRGILTVMAVFGAATVALAAATPEPPRKASVYYSEADLQGIIRAVPAQNGKPGAFSKRLLQDTTHSTAFIRLNAPDTPHAHGIWSEVFVVKSGSGVLETDGRITGVTGTDSATHRDIFVDGPQQAPRAQTAAEREAAERTAARRAASGDLAGTGIEGGTRRRVGPGDVILIPAGVPHRWSQVDGTVVYLDIKFPKAG